MYIMGGRSSMYQLVGISMIPVMEPVPTVRKVEGGKQPLKRDAESRGDSWSGILDPVAEKEIHTLATSLPPRRDVPRGGFPQKSVSIFSSHDAPPTVVYLRHLHTAQDAGLGVVIGLSGGGMDEPEPELTLGEMGGNNKENKDSELTRTAKCLAQIHVASDEINARPRLVSAHHRGPFSIALRHTRALRAPDMRVRYHFRTILGASSTNFLSEISSRSLRGSTRRRATRASESFTITSTAATRWRIRTAPKEIDVLWYLKSASDRSTPPGASGFHRKRTSVSRGRVVRYLKSAYACGRALSLLAPALSSPSRPAALALPNDARDDNAPAFFAPGVDFGARDAGRAFLQLPVCREPYDDESGSAPFTPSRTRASARSDRLSSRLRRWVRHPRHEPRAARGIFCPTVFPRDEKRGCTHSMPSRARVRSDAYPWRGAALPVAVAEPQHSGRECRRERAAEAEEAVVEVEDPRVEEAQSERQSHGSSSYVINAGSSSAPTRDRVRSSSHTSGGRLRAQRSAHGRRHSQPTNNRTMHLPPPQLPPSSFQALPPSSSSSHPPQKGSASNPGTPTPHATGTLFTASTKGEGPSRSSGEREEQRGEERQDERRETTGDD
ncbi:hypothetical protein FB451DRAFT_1378086 [Mycena latifolia]|nr:hypothetical protein FB451DRAFT_1378086 [Mycena latifolia]